eukprot:506724-Prymnesium_polylepis.1
MGDGSMGKWDFPLVSHNRFPGREEERFPKSVYPVNLQHCPGFGFATSDAIHYAIRTARIVPSVPAAAQIADDDVLPAPAADASRAHPVAARPRPAA